MVNITFLLFHFGTTEFSRNFAASETTKHV